MTPLTSTVCALATLLGAARASDGWIALGLPGLCVESRAVREPARLTGGSHLLLPGEEPERDLREASLLPVATLLGWLEDDAGRRKLTVRFSPSAPPLLLRGDDAAIAGVRASLSELERIDAARTIELRAWLLDGEVELASTRPDRAAVARLVAAREPWATRSVRSGESAMLGERVRQSYVASYSVEVATDSGVADPEVGAILTGRTLHLRACRVRGGSALHLEGLLDVAELISLASYATGTPDLGAIQVPTVAAVQVAFAGAIDNGGALAIAIRGASLSTPNLTLLIEARTIVDGAADGGATRTLRGIDLAWIETRATELPLPSPGYGLELAQRTDRAILRDGVGAPTVAQLADELARATNRGLRSQSLFFPGFLIAPSDDAPAWAEIDSLASACERDALSTSDCSVTHGALRVLAPATAGFPWRVLAATERTLLVDYDVEVAQQSWMPSPIVAHVLDGVLVQGHLGAAGLTCGAWVANSREPHQLERKDTSVGRMQTLERACQVGDARVRRGAPRTTLISASPSTPALLVDVRE